MNIRNKTIAATVAAMLAAASLGAAAAGTQAYPTKLAAFEQAPVSAAQAVRAATAQVPGRATEVDFEHKNGQSYYTVEVKAGGQEHDIRVDAVSGQVIGSKVDYDDDQHKAKPAISLERAMEIALAKTGGKVKDAGLDHKRGRAVYEVETVVGGQKYEVKVDGSSGQVLSSRIEY
ncbi:putative membrane protein YkoI [Neisseria sp. HSC-16F19]|nr:PepSY domain-containing protein [Neisseria sp. HSC-16F19]MCP2041753.1 putative membrane protein YkoI [Neisseria sp. HSC-16F19]